MSSKEEYEQFGYKFKLKPGMADVYKQRHDDIWPEVLQMLREAGTIDYAIYNLEGTDELFAHVTRRKDHTWDSLPQNPICVKWWNYMKECCVFNEDGTPETQPMKEMFYMTKE